MFDNEVGPLLVSAGSAHKYFWELFSPPVVETFCREVCLATASQTRAFGFLHELAMLFVKLKLLFSNLGLLNVAAEDITPEMVDARIKDRMLDDARRSQTQYSIAEAVEMIAAVKV